MKPGFLLTFEGSEGCGKSTQIALLKQRLVHIGCPVEVFREPGGTSVGEEIRHVLLNSTRAHALVPEAELLLFLASRAQIVREKVLPLLQKGTFVIMDRFMDSTFVYQGIARGLGLQVVMSLNGYAISPKAVPDRTILLDMPVDVARARILKTGRALDRIESQPIEFFEMVRQGYLDCAKASGERVRIISASPPEGHVHEDIWDLVKGPALRLLDLVSARQSYMVGLECAELTKVEEELDLEVAERGIDRECSANDLEQWKEKRLREMLGVID